MGVLWGSCSEVGYWVRVNLGAQLGDELLEEGAGRGLLGVLLIRLARLRKGKGPFSDCKGLGNIVRIE